MYEFSIPMPYYKNGVDFIDKINKGIEKSKITSVYFALPGTDSDCTGFEQNRTRFKTNTDFNYWLPIIESAKKYNLEVIYLLNSPRPLSLDSIILEKQLEKLDELIKKLKSAGCYSLRVSNTMLLGYLLDNYPDMNYLSSTSFEWTQKKQYKNFIETYPQIKQIVPSFNVNKDFKLLKNLRQTYPNIEVEVMVNEGCIAGCPFRLDHNSSLIPFNNVNRFENNMNLNSSYFLNMCANIQNANLFEYLCTSNIIHPWEIKEYSKIGINKFKLVGRNSFEFANGKYFVSYFVYLLGIDNYKRILDTPYKNLNHYLYNNNSFKYKVKDLIPYLPNIKHFIKNGHKCSSVCGSECNYCYKCAEKMKKALENK